MAKSHKPGTAFSIDLHKSNAALGEIADSPIIRNISSALGTEAELHLVGGMVRKALLGSLDDSDDWDLASRLQAEDALLKLEAYGIHAVPTGIEHGTITVVFPDKKVELTMFRTPSKRDIALPVRSIEEDLEGRDFTINAIAFAVNTRKLIDPHAGIADLEAGLVRAVVSAKKRFEEDPLRILRMVRFGPAEGREIELSTRAAAVELRPSLEKVSIERIRDEFSRIITNACAAQGVRALKDLSLLQYVLPELIPTIDFEQNDYHRFDLFEHILAVLDLCPADLDLRLTALLHDLGKVGTLSVDSEGRRHFYKHEIISAEIADRAMERLRFSKGQTARVSKLVRYHMRPLDCGPSGVRRLMRDLEGDLDTWLHFKKADFIGTKLEEGDYPSQEQKFLAQVTEEKARPVGSPYSALAIDGSDLLKLGMKQGPSVGSLLAEMQELVLDDPDKNTKDTLLKYAQGKLSS